MVEPGGNKGKGIMLIAIQVNTENAFEASPLKCSNDVATLKLWVEQYVQQQFGEVWKWNKAWESSLDLLLYDNGNDAGVVIHEVPPVVYKGWDLK